MRLYFKTFLSTTKEYNSEDTQKHDLGNYTYILLIAHGLEPFVRKLQKTQTLSGVRTKWPINWTLDNSDHKIHFFFFLGYRLLLLRSDKVKETYKHEDRSPQSVKISRENSGGSRLSFLGGHAPGGWPSLPRKILKL